MSTGYQLGSAPAATQAGGTIILVPLQPEDELDPSVDDAIHEAVDKLLRFDSNRNPRQTPAGGSMYGRSDLYTSPPAQFGSDEQDIDDILDEDDEEEEFGAILGIGKGGGILGIALTSKAREKKIGRILGKLKKFYEQDKLDKARRFAKALRGPVKHLEKKGEYDAPPEVVAWLDFAESGDTEALTEALEAVAWTGAEVEPEEVEDDDSDDAVLSDGGGVRGGGGRPRQRLPPGYRPPKYLRWRPAHKIHWLRRHPRAASVMHPADPPGWAGAGAGRPGPFRPGPRPLGPRPRRGLARGGLRGTGVLKATAQRAAARAAGRQYARNHSGPTTSAVPAFPRPSTATNVFRRGRFGALDGAIESGVGEAMGAMGRIGASAFSNFSDSSDFLDPSSLLEDDIDDDLDDLEDEDRPQFGDDDGPQFGAVFRRTVENRLESARSKYESLKARAVTDRDMAKVRDAYTQYQDLAKAYRRAATAPTLKGHERVLAEIQDEPLFRYSTNAPLPQGDEASWDSWMSNNSVPGMDSDDDDLDDDE